MYTEAEELLFCICVSLSTQEKNRGRPGNEARLQCSMRTHLHRNSNGSPLSVQTKLKARQSRMKKAKPASSAQPTAKNGAIASPTKLLAEIPTISMERT